ncbi:hypothetical protein GFS24_01300 [Chitinophaga sp. SYP-B3965]|uniref:trypsin-like peptidase domain-containing protein n=1 Tax=Chitinophaga sp. SYP-B3965 TaxID=2663120 RepID=UPI0012995BB2|nr:trypsin-like peptidase domain-containing protein [Chitinophaga sp. SYP-B3965]MRG43725.1 hypothetical protein [Chitinophaga sp. SYP-B3965]
MSLTPAYYELYAQICKKDQIPVGSGICVDASRIITCAHVVNAALGRPLQSEARPTEEVSVTFPQSETQAETKFSAKIVAWGWEAQPAITSGHDPLSLLMRNDFAVLELQDASHISDNLHKHSCDLWFLKGDLNSITFEGLSYNPPFSYIMQAVSGHFGVEDKRSGTTIMYPDPNPRKFFFEAGSSGSPVLCKVDLGMGRSIIGIAGYADFLNKKSDGTALDARLINGNNIERLWNKYFPDAPLRFKDLDQQRSRIRKTEQTNRIIQERGKTGMEIFCNRIDQLNAIREQRIPRCFFLHGNERQKMDAFIDRYRYEFIASSGKQSRLLFFKMPKDKDVRMFSFRLIGNIFRACHIVEQDHIDAENYTIRDVLDQLDASDDLEFVFDCRIEDADFDPRQEAAYDWFFGSFLKPLKDHPASYPGVHFFISYYFKPGADIIPRQQIILRAFPGIGLPALQNVERDILEEWLDLVEGRDPERRNMIREHYPVKQDYDMVEIISFYKEAIFILDKF